MPYTCCAFYDKLILGREQTVSDLWHDLPKYKGWAFGESPNVIDFSLEIKPIDEKIQDPEIVRWVPPREMKTDAFEIFQTLCNDRCHDPEITTSACVTAELI